MAAVGLDCGVVEWEQAGQPWRKERNCACQELQMSSECSWSKLSLAWCLPRIRVSSEPKTRSQPTEGIRGPSREKVAVQGSRQECGYAEDGYNRVQDGRDWAKLIGEALVPGTEYVCE